MELLLLLLSLGNLAARWSARGDQSQRTVHSVQRELAPHRSDQAIRCGQLHLCRIEYSRDLLE